MQKWLLPLMFVFAVLTVGAGLAIVKFRIKTEATQRVDLLRFWEDYKHFTGVHRRGPKNLEELRNFNFGNNHDSDFDFQRQIEKGSLIVIWDAGLPAADLNAETYLAFSKGALTDGGWVLCGDGSVLLVTSSEFARMRPVRSTAARPGS